MTNASIYNAVGRIYAELIELSDAIEERELDRSLTSTELEVIGTIGGALDDLDQTSYLLKQR